MGAVLDAALDVVALPGSWRRDPTLRAVMSEMMARPGTWAYRGMEAQFLNRGATIRGNPESCCTVLDPYSATRDGSTPRPVQASSLAEPGLNVMLTVPTSYFDGAAGSVLVRFRLGEALDLGGRLYRDVRSAHINAAYITIPEGKNLQVQVIPASALNSLRELMIIENGLFAKRYAMQQSQQGLSPIAPGSPGYLEWRKEAQRLESQAIPLRLHIDALAKEETRRLRISSP